MFDPVEYLSEARLQTVSLGLERTRELLAALGNPQSSLRFVHVAGTNGKGSTCAILASILQHAGYRVGLFTSPALYRFEDRIRVDGVHISAEDLLAATSRVKRVADVMSEHPTEFELLTAVAFCHFEQKECDIVVAEVGLGGRLDSTNVIETVEVSALTPISFDHRAYLGSTLKDIAGEKAGIIKQGVPIVSAVQESEVRIVIEAAAAAAKSTLEEVDPLRLEGTTDRFSYRERDNLSLGLSGSFQLMNAAVALDVIDVLRAAGWNVSEAAIRTGLKRVSWPGRFDIVSEEPLIIFDGSHNPAGMDALMSALDERYPDHYRLVLTGVFADKDYHSIARALEQGADEIVTITPPSSRALPAEDYALTLQQLADSDRFVRVRSVTAVRDISLGVSLLLERYGELLETAEQRVLICVCGSLSLPGRVMEVLRQVGVVL